MKKRYASEELLPQAGGVKSVAEKVLVEDFSLPAIK
jgi:hypothetical protein